MPARAVVEPAARLGWLQLHYGIITLPEDIYYMHYAPVRIVWWQVAAIDGATLALCVPAPRLSC